MVSGPASSWARLVILPWLSGAPPAVRCVLQLKAGTCRVDASETPLQAGGNKLATRGIGYRVLVDDLGQRRQIPVLAAKKVGLAEICSEFALLLRHLDVEAQLLRFAEEVAVLPEAIGAEALAGAV